jgi:hypothetical protein
MLRERRAHLVEKGLAIIAIAMAGIAGTVASCVRIDEKRIAALPALVAIILLIRSSSWWSAPLATFVAASLPKLNSFFGDDRQWKTVQVLIDHLREETFAKDDETKNDPLHHHRITMFKYCRFRACFARWPWSGWMIPVARSGFRTKTKIRFFRASLEKPEDAEGVAGRAFAYGKTISVNDLPSLTIARANPDDLARYAERTFVPLSSIRSNAPGARSLLGIPVEVNGKPWGALVLDSHSPKEITNKKAVYGTLAKVLNAILR